MTAPEATDTQAPDIATSFATVPQAVKDLDSRSTAIQKLYQDSLSKTDENEIEACNTQADTLADEIPAIVTPLIKAFKHLSETVSSNLDQMPQHKAVGAEFGDGLQRYQEVLTQYIKQTGERLGQQYKIMNPHATQSEIEEIKEGDEPWFFSNPGFEPRTDEWHAARKEYIARYTELKKVEKRNKELKEWFEPVNEIRTYGDEPVGGKKNKKKEKKPEKKKPEKKPEKKEKPEKAEKKSGDGEGQESEKGKRKSLGLFARIKLMGRGKSS
ncbi:hypothetical protein ABW20_dc0110216 [Dactylellina cionopaga]|nr:hypothetical protein ABW20_dc0110216 [Dactylellina cionopaga]